MTNDNELREYAREGISEADASRYREYESDPRWREDVLSIAISAYVRDNGDAVPPGLEEELRREIEDELVARAEHYAESRGYY